MNRVVRLSLVVAIGFGMAACSSDKKSDNKAEAKESSCSITLSEDVEMKWISYKTTAKAAVAGGFSDMELTLANNGGATMAEVLGGAKLQISTASVFSGDSIRDSHLRTYFFGTMENGGNLEGQVNSVSGTNKQGDIKVFLNMNGLGENLTMSYKVEEGNLLLTGTVDLKIWNALQSLNALNEKCFDLHKGEDGNSKLWDTVDLNISIPVKMKGC